MIFTTVVHCTKNPSEDYKIEAGVISSCSLSWTYTRTHIYEHIELPARLLDDFLRSNKSNINQLRSGEVSC